MLTSLVKIPAEAEALKISAFRRDSATKSESLITATLESTCRDESSTFFRGVAVDFCQNSMSTKPCPDNSILARHAILKMAFFLIGEGEKYTKRSYSVSPERVKIPSMAAEENIDKFIDDTLRLHSLFESNSYEIARINHNIALRPTGNRGNRYFGFVMTLNSLLIGNLSNGELDGFGVLLGQGRQIEGMWKQSSLNGWGGRTYTIEEETCLVREAGFYINHKLSGWGMTYAPGSYRFTGQHFNGEKNGEGVYHDDHTGITYNGKYKRGLKHGTGRLTLADNSIIEAIWKDGVLGESYLKVVTDDLASTEANHLTPSMVTAELM